MLSHDSPTPKRDAARRPEHGQGGGRRRPERDAGSRRRLSQNFPRRRDQGAWHVAGRSARRGPKLTSLTAREWAILEVLARRSGRPVPHVDRLESVWGEVTDAATDTLAVLIGRLRRSSART